VKVMVVFPGSIVRGRYRPLITILIVTINVLVYIYTTSRGTPLLVSSEEIFYKYGFIPHYLLTDLYEGVLRIFTSMFIHADIVHIFFNMYFLWLFGSRLEGFIGHGKMLLLYLISGITATLFHVAFIPVGGYDALTIPAVGASGAISGVLGAYLLALPHTKLYMCWFFMFIPLCFSLPAEAFMVIWFAQQVIYGYLRLGGVAYFAHIGGFVMGLVLGPLLTRHVARQGLTPEILRYIERVLGVIIPRPRGVSTGVKVVLVLLLLAVAGGFLYASQATTRSQIYTSSITATRVDREAPAQSDRVVFALTPSGLVTSTSRQEYVRILVNRLVGTPYVYNPGLAEREEYVEWRGYVTVSGVRVPVVLNMSARYDELGVLVESRGVMGTVSVVISQYGVSPGETMVLSFDISSSRVHRAGQVLSGVCLVAAGVSFLAVVSVTTSRGALLHPHEELFAPYL